MYAILFAITSLLGQSETAPADAQGVVAHVQRNFDAFRALPGLYLSYLMTYEHQRGDNQFTEPRVEAVNVYTGENVFAEVKTSTEERRAAWNGLIGTESHQAVRPSYRIRPETGTWAVGMQYYADALFYPIGRARIEDPDKRPPWPPYYKGPDYWLPSGFERNPDRYRVLPQRETTDGADCVVLDWAGRDRIWLDPALGYAIRKREFQWPSGTMRDRLVSRDFQHMAENLWLPREIVHEQFCTADDPPAMKNLVSGIRTIRVSEMRVEAAPESTFIVEVPEGAVVNDMVRHIFYERVNPGDDPIARAEAEVRRQLGQSSWLSSWVTWLVAGVIALAVGLLAYRRFFAFQSPT